MNISKVWKRKQYRLWNDSSVQADRPYLKRGRRGKQCMQLDEIWALNDKQLVALFAEPAANELTKNFAYTCALMPETCAKICTSFGSELKARTAITEHLLDHLRELVSRSRGMFCGLWRLFRLPYVGRGNVLHCVCLLSVCFLVAEFWPMVVFLIVSRIVQSSLMKFHEIWALGRLMTGEELVKYWNWFRTQLKTHFHGSVAII